MIKSILFTIAVLLGFSCLKNTTTQYKNMEAIIQEIIDKKPQNQADFEAIIGVRLTKNGTHSTQYFDKFEAKDNKNTAFESVELRLSIPNSGATNGSIIVFDIAENMEFSKDKIWLRYGAAVAFVIARPEDVSQTNYLTIKRPGYYISYEYKGKSDACTGLVLNFEKLPN